MTAISYMVATSDPWTLLAVGYLVGATATNLIYVISLRRRSRLVSDRSIRRFVAQVRSEMES